MRLRFMFLLMVSILTICFICIYQQRVLYEKNILNIFRTYPISHITAWNSIDIKDKMVLCAYGSSGNKLGKQDLKEITERYGVK